MTVASMGPGNDPFEEIPKKMAQSLQEIAWISLERSSIVDQLNASLRPLLEAQKRQILAVARDMAAPQATRQLIATNRAVARQMHVAFVSFDLRNQLSVELSAKLAVRVAGWIEEIEGRPDEIPVTDTPILDDEATASIVENASNLCRRIAATKNLTTGAITVVVFAECLQFLLEHPEVQAAADIALGLPTTIAMLAWLLMQQVSKKK